MKYRNYKRELQQVKHGLFRLVHKINGISDLVLDSEDQESILLSLDEALEEALQLYLLTRQTKEVT
jgi:hypothetical protein